MDIQDNKTCVYRWSTLCDEEVGCRKCKHYYPTCGKPKDAVCMNRLCDGCQFLNVPKHAPETSKQRISRPPRAHSMLRAAYAIAEQSTCRRRAVGCILLGSHHKILATGYNGRSSGQPHCLDTPCEGADAPSGTGLDACEAIHAEQNALMQCVDVRSIITCITTTSPCITCVKLLMNTSCTKIVFAEEYPHTKARELWLKSSPVRKWQKIDL